MASFIWSILAASALGCVADLVVLHWLVSSREKPARVWGRLGQFAYHLAVAAWAGYLAFGGA